MFPSLILLIALFFQGGGQRQFPGQQQPGATPQASPSPTGKPGGGQQGSPQPQATPTPEKPPVVPKHSINAGGTTINYPATAGMMPIKNREGEVEARMFFVSYVV